MSITVYKKPNIRTNKNKNKQSYDESIDLRPPKHLVTNTQVNTYGQALAAGTLSLVGGYLYDRAGRIVQHLAVNAEKAVVSKAKQLASRATASAPTKTWTDIVTGAPVAETAVRVSKTGVPYTKTTNPSNKQTSVDHDVQLVAKYQGKYVMGRTGKKALSNAAFRGTNTSNVRHAPAAISRRMNVVNKPKMRNGKDGLVVHHKEYMSNIVSNATTLGFKAVGLTLNPGKISTFPWLSTLAGNFDKYRIISCTISLVTNQPTTTAGRIGVGFDYDSTDPVPDDRTDFFSLTHHAECAAWDCLDFTIPLQGGVRFVNSHTVTDSKLIDYGQVILMTDQIVTTGTAINLGDAIIEYAVELIDPQQAIMLTYALVGKNPPDFTSMTQVGPVIGEMVPTASTTVVEHRLSIGYYLIVVTADDTGTGTPGLSFNFTSGTTGKLNVASTTVVNTAVAVVHVLADDSTFRLTLSSVAINDLEGLFVYITRIAPPVYVKSVAATWQGNITASL